MTRESVRPLLVGGVSTTAVLALLGWWVTTSPQWPRIQAQFFDPDAMRAAFPRVLDGFWLNLRIFAVAQVAILVLALLVAVVRSLTGPVAAPLRLGAVVFVDLLRGVPSLLLILLFGFGIPALQLPGLSRSSLFWGTVALVLSYSAYTAEVYRSGMDAVHGGQRAAAKALGLSQWQTLRFAIVPQAIRNVTPALLNGAVSLQKDVVLLSVIGVREAVREAQIYTSSTFNYSSYLVAAGLFLLASVPLARFTDYYARRDMQRRLQRTF
ncbi:amino acid ABC transporter permease [Egicoccus halophilus]|uniref:ABC transporter permease n=1 Tax=Egicoccus halophilus TaxID=1670830 RepID=A0A8J3A831_9ACTN|nr:ABC transporter permease subunit [Egicoccus halophilus]GGI06388.1 ABC transporter permease [Egicoccus halophilus]